MAGLVWADVPPTIEAGLRKIGPIVDPACTAKLYRPLMPAKDITSGDPNPYPGVRVLRNQSFGKDPKDVVDIFAGDKGPASRDVLIYVPGGGGDKIEIQNKEANAFYDNIGRWAAKHGMAGIGGGDFAAPPQRQLGWRCERRVGHDPVAPGARCEVQR
jgi:triacylglycerol lipase